MKFGQLLRVAMVLMGLLGGVINASPLAAQEGANGASIKKSAIVMLGDSITHGGKWNELLGRDDVSNHGISGDTTDRIFARLQAVIDEQPRICFVMAGVNDISHGFPVEVVFSNLRRIYRDLKSQRIIPVVQSTLYTRNPKFNQRIEQLNRQLARFARRNGLDYIDLNGVLARNKLLDNKFTQDGIHLRAVAYEEWKTQVQLILDRHKIRPKTVRNLSLTH